MARAKQASKRKRPRKALPVGGRRDVPGDGGRRIGGSCADDEEDIAATHASRDHSR